MGASIYRVPASLAQEPLETEQSPTTRINSPGRLHSSTSVRRSTRTMRGGRTQAVGAARRSSRGPPAGRGRDRLERAAIADRAVELGSVLAHEEDVARVDRAAGDLARLPSRGTRPAPARRARHGGAVDVELTVAICTLSACAGSAPRLT